MASSIADAAQALDARVSELVASGLSTRRATLIAVLEVSPDAVTEIGRQKSRALDREARRGEVVAAENVAMLVGSESIAKRRLDLDDDGLFGFEVTSADRRHQWIMLMPGIPAHAWKFERCCIDGNSWMWRHATELMREHARWT